MPPAYYKYDDEGVYSFYANIIQKVPEIEIILYNFEKLSGYKFSIQIIEKLIKNFPKQIVGVKDSTYNLYDKINIPNYDYNIDNFNDFNNFNNYDNNGYMKNDKYSFGKGKTYLKDHIDRFYNLITETLHYYYEINP